MAARPASKRSPEELEHQWFRDHYRGDMRQLTWRAVLMGACLGAVLSMTNLYVGLKTGWGFGVAITACVLSFAIWKGVRKLGLARTDMSILENNAMQSTASAAGYSTGGTLVSAVAAYLIVTGHHIPYGLLTAWIFFLAVLGVTLAIPMKRQMINVERLRFPSGIAAAMTLRSLHNDIQHRPALAGPLIESVDEEPDTMKSAEEAAMEAAKEVEGTVTSAKDGEKSAQSLFLAASFGALVAFLRDGFTMLHELGILGARLRGAEVRLPGLRFERVPVHGGDGGKRAPHGRRSAHGAPRGGERDARLHPLLGRPGAPDASDGGHRDARLPHHGVVESLGRGRVHGDERTSRVRVPVEGGGAGTERADLARPTARGEELATAMPTRWTRSRCPHPGSRRGR